MNIHASLRYLRVSPRKVRLVVDLIRGADIATAEQRLLFSPKWAARPVLKLLRSAVANATNNFHLDAKKLFVKKISADQGPTLKRYRPRAFGSAAEIRKRSTHILLVLATKETPKPEKKVKASAAQEKPRAEKSASPKKVSKQKPVTSPS